MTEERPVRDRLGEALCRLQDDRRTDAAYWREVNAVARQLYCKDADTLIRFAAYCGLKIELASPSPDAGGRG